jgi:NAD(P)-dependent dehydrogenase (short-subunit alcohol dehydrogenase family)
MAESIEKPTPPFPAQHQDHQPGYETEMQPQPQSVDPDYRGSEKLKGKVALITGGDSGIGRAIAISFAKEGADAAIVYLNEEEDAEETKRLINENGQKCLLLPGDIRSEDFCQYVVDETIKTFGRLDSLINNAAEQHPQESITGITAEQLDNTFRTNIFSMFYLSKAAFEHLKPGSAIINTASVTAYKGHPNLLDYSATKGAIVSFTRSLSLSLSEFKIRVNAVAPGPIWTPLIPSTFTPEHVENFGENVPMKRPGQPDEVAKCFVFLASDDSSYLSGQVIHPNGGTVVNG